MRSPRTSHGASAGGEGDRSAARVREGKTRLREQIGELTPSGIHVLARRAAFSPQIKAWGREWDAEDDERHAEYLEHLEEAIDTAHTRIPQAKKVHQIALDERMQARRDFLDTRRRLGVEEPEDPAPDTPTSLSEARP